MNIWGVENVSPLKGYMFGVGLPLVSIPRAETFSSSAPSPGPCWASSGCGLKGKEASLGLLLEVMVETGDLMWEDWAWKGAPSKEGRERVLGSWALLRPVS